MASHEDEEKTCQLCWGDEDDGPLVQPCVCRGSAKWIHKACVEEWRRTGPREDAAHRCSQCKDEVAMVAGLGETLGETPAVGPTIGSAALLGQLWELHPDLRRL